MSAVWDQEIRASVTVGDRRHDLLFNATGATLEWDANAAVAFSLMPSMRAGVQVTWPGVSPLLASNLPAIQGIYRSFVPSLRELPIALPDRVRPRRTSQDVGLFFSGGLDSLHVLATRMEDITDLILVHGFDVDWTDETAFAAVREHATQVAARYGKRLTVVRTNLREMSDQYTTWEMYHGGALAGMALMAGFRTAFIGSSYGWAQLHAWGSHPVLDPLWSTEQTTFEHIGADTGRIDKVREIAARHPELLERLRVCWKESREYNCGRCEKCLRTIANLALAGATGHCRSLPAVLPPLAIRRLPLSAGAAYFWQEIYDERGLPADVQRAIAVALHNQRYGLTPIDGTLKSRVKRWRDQLLLLRAVYAFDDRQG
jgi:hypothetical protein